jgi:hypothetical protein
VRAGGLGLLAPSLVAVADAIGDAMSADSLVIADWGASRIASVVSHMTDGALKLVLVEPLRWNSHVERDLPDQRQLNDVREWHVEVAVVPEVHTSSWVARVSAIQPQQQQQQQQQQLQQQQQQQQQQQPPIDSMLMTGTLDKLLPPGRAEDLEALCGAVAAAIERLSAARAGWLKTLRVSLAGGDRLQMAVKAALWARDRLSKKKHMRAVDSARGRCLLQAVATQRLHAMCDVEVTQLDSVVAQQLTNEAQQLMRARGAPQPSEARVDLVSEVPAEYAGERPPADGRWALRLMLRRTADNEVLNSDPREAFIEAVRDKEDACWAAFVNNWLGMPVGTSAPADGVPLVQHLALEYLGRATFKARSDRLKAATVGRRDPREFREACCLCNSGGSDRGPVHVLTECMHPAIAAARHRLLSGIMRLRGESAAGCSQLPEVPDDSWAATDWAPDVRLIALMLGDKCGDITVTTRRGTTAIRPATRGGLPGKDVVHVAAIAASCRTAPTLKPGTIVVSGSSVVAPGRTEWIAPACAVPVWSKASKRPLGASQPSAAVCISLVGATLPGVVASDAAWAAMWADWLKGGVCSLIAVRSSLQVLGPDTDTIIAEAASQSQQQQQQRQHQQLQAADPAFPEVNMRAAAIGLKYPIEQPHTLLRIALLRTALLLTEMQLELTSDLTGRRPRATRPSSQPQPTPPPSPPPPPPSAPASPLVPSAEPPSQSRRRKPAARQGGRGRGRGRGRSADSRRPPRRAPPSPESPSSSSSELPILLSSSSPSPSTPPDPAPAAAARPHPSLPAPIPVSSDSSSTSTSGDGSSSYNSSSDVDEWGVPQSHWRFVREAEERRRRWIAEQERLRALEPQQRQIHPDDMTNADITSSVADEPAHDRGASSGARRSHSRPGHGFQTDSDE